MFKFLSSRFSLTSQVLTHPIPQVNRRNGGNIQSSLNFKHNDILRPEISYLVIMHIKIEESMQAKIAFYFYCKLCKHESRVK